MDLPLEVPDAEQAVSHVWGVVFRPEPGPDFVFVLLVDVYDLLSHAVRLVVPALVAADYPVQRIKLSAEPGVFLVEFFL